ncbi:MAG: SPOR domain-containing protein, partial [Candidatus Tectimicrobiota bacterium]
MKTINLLKEGHGLRFAPSRPALDDPGQPPLERPAPRKPRRRAVKIVVALVLVVLFTGGGWWVYQTFGPWGPRLEALRRSVAGRQTPKPPAAPAPVAKPKPTLPTEAKAPPPPAAAPAPPPPPRVTAAQVGRWFRADRAYPFTLLVGSFRQEAQAVAYAGRLVSAGHSVTVAPTDLGTRGRWHRVLLDRYEA